MMTQGGIRLFNVLADFVGQRKFTLTPEPRVSHWNIELHDQCRSPQLSEVLMLWLSDAFTSHSVVSY